MSEHIFIAVAWPYANGSLHMGHIAGCYLPADIFARYHRMRGNHVLMVSGSDQHGTPVTLKAENEGVSPQELVDYYQAQFLECWTRLGIGWDLFTTTGTENHRETVHEIFQTLLERGFIYRETMMLPYCLSCARYLPDRYVTGTCPHCGSNHARGDQCDECGKPLDPQDLIDLRCGISGDVPEFRNREHYFLRLSGFGDQLLTWLQDKDFWRPNVINFTRRFIADGLLDRAITRDISWGVSVPVESFEDRRIYVWFEAVIGYLSASKEWAKIHGNPDAWRVFWGDEARAYYFIGKDNIPFHSIIWPAMLMGYGGLALPHNIPANEFLTLEGHQLSTSRNWAVWIPEYLERYQPDPLRFCLAAGMPESSDSDFTWREFVRRNNDELVATYGNLVHRVLTFTYRNFQERIPTPGSFDQRSQDLLDMRTQALRETSVALEACRFRDALRVAMGLAQETNRYLDEKAPWRALREDPGDCATTLWVSIAIISTLKILLYPFIPFSSNRLHSLLGFTGSVEDVGWDVSLPSAGQVLMPPIRLFEKIDPEVIEREEDRLGS